MTNGGKHFEEDFANYVPAHSDFLIHWTGKYDIDEIYDPFWFNNNSSTTSKKVTDLYLDRLKSILKFGLWMMDEEENIKMGAEKYLRPVHFRTCFTELKLSAVRSHAKRYGRLGIGFKRFFLFERLGSPMTYYHDGSQNWFMPSLWSNCSSSFDEFFSCFLKPMTEITSDSTIKYTYYDESEWRIIYSTEIADRLKNRGMAEFTKKFIMEENFCSELRQIVSKLTRRPRATIPVLDRWLAIIIYPSLAAKVEAEADQEIRNLINSIKPPFSFPHTYEKKENPSQWEQFKKPIELNLDACRNF